MLFFPVCLREQELCWRHCRLCPELMRSCWEFRACCANGRSCPFQGDSRGRRGCCEQAGVGTGCPLWCHSVVVCSKHQLSWLLVDVSHPWIQDLDYWMPQGWCWRMLEFPQPSPAVLPSFHCARAEPVLVVPHSGQDLTPRKDFQCLTLQNRLRAEGALRAGWFHLPKQDWGNF